MTVINKSQMHNNANKKKTNTKTKNDITETSWPCVAAVNMKLYKKSCNSSKKILEKITTMTKMLQNIK